MVAEIMESLILTLMAVIVFTLGGCFGNQQGHTTIATECDKLGAFYVGDVVYQCARKKP